MNEPSAGHDPSQKIFKSLKRCFGSQFQSASLGKKHLDKGIYIDQIQRWLVNFDRRNFYFMSYEKWRDHPVEETKKFMQFLHPDCEGLVDNVSNISHVKYRLVRPNRLTVPMPSDIKEVLAKYYYPYNQRLAQLLGNDFDYNNIT